MPTRHPRFNSRSHLGIELPSAMERAAGSYARATGGKEPMQSDRAKQNEAARRKIAEETLEQIPVHELRERTPAERASDYMRDYNALYDVPGDDVPKEEGAG